jgi:hypothetical protein
MIVANLFRRLKEVRQLGEAHVHAQRLETMKGESEWWKMTDDNDECVVTDSYLFSFSLLCIADASSYAPKTLRQTKVLVVPSNPHFRNSFVAFDRLLQAIQEARRQARDYNLLTATKDDSENKDNDQQPWSVSINCAHLHPDFGVPTKAQELEAMKKEDEPEEVDLNYLDYQEKKLQARRSPYPTIVIEVRATPPVDNFGDLAATARVGQPEPPCVNDKPVTANDIAKLEALFGKSAHIRESTDEDLFYDALAETLDHVEMTNTNSSTFLQRAQAWMTQHDTAAIHQASQVAFVESSTIRHVDEAYEFFFTNVAMVRDHQHNTHRHRQYLVLPQFLPTSATSLEQFAQSARSILEVLPDLDGHMQLEVFHPEHINPQQRSPMPVLVLEWNKA